MTLQTGPVQGRAVELGAEVGDNAEEQHSCSCRCHKPTDSHHYLVMGVGVPSIRQVFVNQGLLVLGSCLQEPVQIHRLQWGLGWWWLLYQLKDKAKSHSSCGHLGLCGPQAVDRGPAHCWLVQAQFSVLPRTLAHGILSI